MDVGLMMKYAEVKSGINMGKMIATKNDNGKGFIRYSMMEMTKEVIKDKREVIMAVDMYSL